MSKKTKVLLGHTHIGYVNTELLQRFRQEFGIVNFSSWLRKIIKERFDFTLLFEDDLLVLREKVEACYYDDIGEWLQDEMRRALREKEKEGDVIHGEN